MASMILNPVKLAVEFNHHRLGLRISLWTNNTEITYISLLDVSLNMDSCCSKEMSYQEIGETTARTTGWTI